MHRTSLLGALVALLVAALASTVLASPPPWPQWPMPVHAPLIEQGRRGMPPEEEFGLFYSISADRPEWFNIQAGQVPFRQDVVLVSAEAGNLYPRQGPHIIETFPGGRPAFYAAFVAQLQGIITGWITDPGYDGLISLDYEFFCPWWTGHYGWASSEGPLALDYDFLQDWRDTLSVTRASHLAGLNTADREAYFKREWEATTREFFERAVAAVRQVRPLAKIGIYNQPTQTYWSWIFPDSAHAMRVGHDDVRWFWDLVDVILPSIYCSYQSIPDGQTRGPGQDHQASFDAYCRNNIAEAIRVAKGKPVYVYVSFVYHPSNAHYGNQPVNAHNLQRPFQIAREMGTDGAVVWGWVRSQQQYDTMAPFFANTVVPFLEEFSALPALPIPEDPCTADLGAQGGVPSSDGSLDQNDFVAFVSLYFGLNYRADVGKQGGVAGSDGLLDNNDFVSFVNIFMSNCR